jgi:hypothetical protein
VAHEKCWTADRLALRGLDHPEECPLCDQDDETIDHLLVFAKQFWLNLLRQANLQDLARQLGTVFFLNWWRELTQLSTGLTRRGTNSLILLSAWILWKHQNHCIFDGMEPSLVSALAQADEERKMWKLAGAKEISFLMRNSQVVRAMEFV